MFMAGLLCEAMNKCVICKFNRTTYNRNNYKRLLSSGHCYDPENSDYYNVVRRDFLKTTGEELIYFLKICSHFYFSVRPLGKSSTVLFRLQFYDEIGSQPLNNEMASNNSNNVTSFILE